MRFLSVIVLVLAALGTVQCQQMTPFLGQGTPPEGGCTVYITIALDRLIDIDDSNYRFECILFFLMTWSDPRAKPAMLAATEAQKNGTNCTMPCTSMYNEDSLSQCCDGVWLPHLEFMNARGFSQDRIVRYAIQFGEGQNSSAVGWWAQVAGEYYTNLDFRAFPFDTQNLVIQIGYADRTPEIPVTFVQDTTALSYFLPKAGDDISGWSVKNITMSFYNITEKQIYSRFGVSKAGDPFPIHPSDPFYPDIFRAALWRQGFVIYIQIDRIYVYFILTAIVPIALNVWLALLVFSVSPKHLDTRLGIIVTLFLSLTALMLVVGDVLPQSSVIVPTQQLVLLSYLILGFVGLESIILYKIVTAERQRNIKKRTLQAKKKFLKRWDALSTSFRQTHTAAVRSSKSGLGLAFRRRKTLNGASTSAGALPDPSGVPQDVAVDLPTDFQQFRSPQTTSAATLATSPFDQTASVQDGGDQRRDQRVLMTTMSTKESQQQLPFGGINVGIDSDDSQPFGGNSNGSDFDSSDDGRNPNQDPKNSNAVNNRDGATTTASHGRMSAIKAWFVLAGRKMKETNREIKTNPDYALYWALSVDKWVFWITLIAYNTALIVIFAINATYQAPVVF